MTEMENGKFTKIDLSKYIALDTNLSSCSTIRTCHTDLMKISKIKQKDKNKNNYNISEQLELISQNSKNRTLENSNILEQNLKIINKIQYGKFIKFYLINSIIKNLIRIIIFFQIFICYIFFKNNIIRKNS